MLKPLIHRYLRMLPTFTSANIAVNKMTLKGSGLVAGSSLLSGVQKASLHAKIFPYSETSTACTDTSLPASFKNGDSERPTLSGLLVTFLSILFSKASFSQLSRVALLS
jgi:hypothetical protein